MKSSRINVSWASEHRDKDGKLIVRQATIEHSAFKCIRFTCIIKYLLSTVIYVMVCYYHKCRVEYAEKHRRDVIPERYRTGELSPETIWQALKEISQLKLRR